MKIIQRNTEVVSVSLSKEATQKLEDLRKIRGQTRSSFVASLIDQVAEEERWQRIYKRGEKTAHQFKITSEEEIDRLLHESTS